MNRRLAIILWLCIAAMSCQTVKPKRPEPAAVKASTSQLNRDVGQMVRWRWYWNARTATLREPFLFQIMYVNSPYLGLRADAPLSAANGCVAGSDCTVDCGFEVYRPSSKEGEVLTDRMQVSCTMQNRAYGRQTVINLSGLADGLNVSYRPKVDGPRSVAIRGPFATEMFFSFQKAQQAGRYLAGLGAVALQTRPVAYQYLVLKNNWYFVYRLDAQQAIPGDNNLSIMCSAPPTDADDSTCIFRL